MRFGYIFGEGDAIEIKARLRWKVVKYQMGVGKGAALRQSGFDVLCEYQLLAWS